ncbi:MTSS I-BAR domain containing 2a isoform X4 [Larimichthys crocea]|uniref:MTSS I-BAR domain containing 2a isoform X4 n=1 Tax=Larimichthys crocea TaxID=215358 RepID=UPI000F600AAC|nr:MTSS1-like protein isoform X4 [Larimichthys crocea]
MVYIDPLRDDRYLPPPKAHQHLSNSYLLPIHLSSLTSLSLFLSISSSPPLFLLHLPFTRNQQAQPPLRLQKPASLSASATLLQRLVMHAFRRFFGHTHTRTELHTYTRCAVHFIHCYLQFKETRGLYLTAALRFDVDYSWILSTLTQTCLSVPQFGSCSSFGTFRPAFSHTGTIRPLSVILPASPTFNHSPGSNTPSPTSKIPSWKDWAKSSSCEPSLASTLHRRRESVDKMRELEAPPSPLGYSVMQADDPHRARIGPGTIAAKHGEPLSPAASTLAMVLTRGLSMEQQKSSRDSLQYSSGYSTQTNTPSCSEDTIPSQGSDYECYSLNGDADSEGQADFDKSSTIPRHSNIAQSYRRMIQTKRPASTAGLPAGKTLQGTPNGAGGSSSGAITSGTATIRRTPSSKTGVRRTPSTSGPIPIRPPIVPVKTPTVPDSPGYASPSQYRMGSEEFIYGDDPSSSDYMRGSPKRMSLPDNAWGCGGGGGADRTVYAQQAPSMVSHSAEEDPLLAANRHSLVEKIGELAASAHALGEGHFPFRSSLPGDQALCAPQEPSPMAQEDMDMLVSIRRGVKLRKAVTDDRSAPRILR